MKELKIEAIVDICQIDELNESEKELVLKAIDATNNSYAPYSNFNVGAAIRLEDNSIVIGANQENAAFPVSLCAERTAIFAAQAQHPELSITQLAIAAKAKGEMTQHPVSPCGSCRQVIMEMEDRYKRDIEILLYGREYIYRLKSVKDLLPLYFTNADME